VVCLCVCVCGVYVCLCACVSERLCACVRACVCGNEVNFAGDARHHVSQPVCVCVITCDYVCV
jgi:hypothetical protein